MTQTVKRHTKWILVALMAIGGLAALLGAASQAIWTDSDDVGGNDFATGNISLTTAPTSAIWGAVTGQVPGVTSGSWAVNWLVPSNTSFGWSTRGLR